MPFLLSGVIGDFNHCVQGHVFHAGAAAFWIISTVRNSRGCQERGFRRLIQLRIGVQSGDGMSAGDERGPA